MGRPAPKLSINSQTKKMYLYHPKRKSNPRPPVLRRLLAPLHQNGCLIYINAYASYRGVKINDETITTKIRHIVVVQIKVIKRIKLYFLDFHVLLHIHNYISLFNQMISNILGHFLFFSFYEDCNIFISILGLHIYTYTIFLFLNFIHRCEYVLKLIFN